MAVPKYLKDLLPIPTAAYVETDVLAYIRDAVAKFDHVSLKADRYGNLMAHYRHRPRKVTPLVFTAHTDHPGFVAEEMLGDKRLRAAFRGGVVSSFFRNGQVKFWSDGDWVKGKVRAITKSVPVPRLGPDVSRPLQVELDVAAPVVPDAPGVWDLPEPKLKGDRLHARPCDDLAGAAAMLTLLQRLSRQQAAAEVYCLFTRAEEVGFIGALGAIAARTVPKKLPVIVIEMSKELPNAQIGDGPIIRVGDRMSVFTPELTLFCERVAQRLAKRRKKFAYQRKLMDGGACEATAYVAYGYRANCICLPLGNYHNMDTERSRIGNEYISLTDWQRMVDLFEALVLDEDGFGVSEHPIRRDLDESFDKAEPLLSGNGVLRRARSGGRQRKQRGRAR